MRISVELTNGYQLDRRENEVISKEILSFFDENLHEELELQVSIVKIYLKRPKRAIMGYTLNPKY
jgi:hypothetical protein